MRDAGLEPRGRLGGRELNFLNDYTRDLTFTRIWAGLFSQAPDYLLETVPSDSARPRGHISVSKLENPPLGRRKLILSWCLTQERTIKNARDLTWQGVDVTRK